MPLRGISGSVVVGIPQRTAFALAHCSTHDEFTAKHTPRDLSMPLLCHTHVSRVLRTKDGEDGASQPAEFVNHNLELVEPVSWDTKSAPNAAFTSVLGILNNCPRHNEGIHSVFLEDILTDPHYGMRINYDGQEGTRGLYAAAVVTSSSKSKQEQVSEHGYNVATSC